MLIYFLKKLPWDCGFSLVNNESDHISFIFDMKESSFEDRSLFENVPGSFSLRRLILYLAEFETFLKYSRNLKFKENPNYCYLRTLFLNLYRARKFGLTPEGFPLSLIEWNSSVSILHVELKQDMNNNPYNEAHAKPSQKYIYFIHYICILQRCFF